MLRITALSRSYANRFAVQDITIEIAPGSFVGVIGRSGAGKSTLLRMINRLVDPTSGSITFEGIDVTALKGGALRRWRRRCAMVFQQFNLVGRLDVLSNVLMGRIGYVPAWRALLKLWPREDRVIALAALEQLDIGLADEPIASLDPRNTKVVMDALLRINRELGITIICNLHSLDLARGYCDRLIGMAQGRVVFNDVPAALTDDVARELYGLEAGEVMAAKLPETAVV